MNSRYDEMINSFDSVEENSTEVASQEPSTIESPDTVPSTESSQDDTDTHATAVTDTQPSSTSESTTDTTPDVSNAKPQSNNAPNSQPKKEYTHEEKLQYNLTRQSKENHKLKRQLREAEARNAEFEKRLKALEDNSKPSAELTEDDFESKADYYKYIAKQEILNQLNEAKKLKESNDKISNDAAQAQQDFLSKAQQLYTTEEDIKSFNTVISQANEDGFFQDLAEDETIMSFVKSSPISPRLMFHFAAMREDADRIMALDNVSKIYELNKLQDKLIYIFSKKPNNPPVSNQSNQSTQSVPNNTQGQSAPKGLPDIGRVKGASTSSNPDVSMDDVMSNLRNGFYH